MMGHGKRKVTSTKRQRPNPKLDYEPVDDDVGESSVAGGEDGQFNEDEEPDTEWNELTYDGEKYPWKFHQYTTARKVTQFDNVNDSMLPQFHTKVQLNVFFGHIMKCKVHNHHTIALNFLKDFPQVVGVIELFQLKESLNF